MKCLNCFNECLEGMRFCNVCGAPLTNTVQPRQSTPVQGGATVNGATAQNMPPRYTAPTATQARPVTPPVQNGAAQPRTQAYASPNPFTTPPQQARPQQAAYAPTRPNTAAAGAANAQQTARPPVDSMKITSPSEPIPQKMVYPPTKEELRKKAKNAAEYAAVSSRESRGTKALQIGQFVTMEILLYIPVINIILLIMWAMNSKGNPNRRNYAIAKLICIPLLTALFIIAAVVLYATGTFDSMIAALESYLV